MKTKQILAASACILALGMAQTAEAVIEFEFDPTGGGAGSNYSLFDQVPGNAIAINGISAITNFRSGGPAAENEFTRAYQGNLGLAFGVGPTYENGSDGNFFNFTMQYQEAVTSIVGGGSSFISDFVDAGTNTFTMYRSSTLANDLTGAGYGAGTVVLAGKVITSTSQHIDSGANSDRLDNFSADDWAGTGSIVGLGTSNLVLEILSVDAGYFPDLVMTDFITFGFFDNSQVTPFNQVDPSRSFDWLAGGAHVSNVGNNNGTIGPDFLYQADANISFDKDQVQAPEPTTLILLGLGLGRSKL